MFSLEIQVFFHNMDKLTEKAPILVAYATIPGFGSIVMLVISIIGILISTEIQCV